MTAPLALLDDDPHFYRCIGDMPTPTGWGAGEMNPQQGPQPDDWDVELARFRAEFGQKIVRANWIEDAG